MVLLGNRRKAKNQMTVRYLIATAFLLSCMVAYLAGWDWWAGRTLAESATVGVLVLLGLRPVAPK